MNVRETYLMRDKELTLIVQRTSIEGPPGYYDVTSSET